jgi:hypothetical protein
VPPKEAARHSHGVADARRKGRAALYMAVVVPGRSCGRPAGGRRCRQQPHPHCRHLPGWLLAGMGARWLGPACGHASLVTTSAASGFPRSPRSKVHVGGGLKALHLA